VTSQPIALGESSFRNLREQGCYFVDKTPGLIELLSSRDLVVLIPRPRRFGKTLFLNLCREFFDRTAQNAEALFEGLAIRRHPYWQQHFGKYPVMKMTFKDVTANRWEDCREALHRCVEALFWEHMPTLRDLTLEGVEKASFERFKALEPSEADYRNLPALLSKWLHQATGMPVILLIDEYDTPIHAAWHGGYYDKIIDFMRSFLSSACKDNPHLYKALITGILRVAKESIFSGMNNLGVYTIDSACMHTAFGFTEDEVEDLLVHHGLGDHLPNVRHWYNGYRFGPERTTIYNPWSVLNYTSRPADGFRSYWVNTARNDLIENLMLGQGSGMREELDNLVHGECILKTVEDSVSMRDIEARPDLVWSLLYHSGYLRCDDRGQAETRALKAPNEEVRQIYLSMVRRWFAQKLPGNDQSIEELARALQGGDTRLFQRMFNKILKEVVSHHDLAGHPERVYHALFLGMLVWLEPWYQIRSNRESGYGRYDLALYPKNPEKRGYVIEFKRADADCQETLEGMVQDALNQMKSKNYATDILAQGCAGVTLIAIAFQGKEHRMVMEDDERNKDHEPSNES